MTTFTNILANTNAVQATQSAAERVIYIKTLLENESFDPIAMI